MLLRVWIWLIYVQYLSLAPKDFFLPTKILLKELCEMYLERAIHLEVRVVILIFSSVGGNSRSLLSACPLKLDMMIRILALSLRDKTSWQVQVLLTPWMS